MSKSKTTEDLREILFDEIKSLRKGETTATQATAVSKLATNIINSAAIEVTCSRVVRMDGPRISPMSLTHSD